jgi:plasmid stability protein
LAERNTDDVLDAAVLECLAVLAAANGRSVEEELNVAVKTYVINTFADRGVEPFVKLAVSEAHSSGPR